MADRLAACEAAAAKMEALKPQIDRLDREIEELNSQGAAARLEACSIRERIKPVPYGAWQSIQRRLAPANDIVSCCILRRGEIKAKLQMIDEATEQIAQLRSELTEIAEKLNDYTTLVQAFGIDGIQYMIIRGVVPEIMRQSNDILASMTGGRMAVDFRTEREQKSTKQIVNSLEVWINTISGGTRPYQSHSGGEKVKIALAVTLGLADVKARRAGVQLGMFYNTLHSMPNKYNNGKLRWLMSPHRAQEWELHLLNQIIEKGGAVPESVYNSPAKIPVVECPSLGDDSVLLTDPKNLVVVNTYGMKIRKTTEGKEAIMKDKRFYVIHFDFDPIIEEMDAAAIIKGIK